jgi:signal peptidase I
LTVPALAHFRLNVSPSVPLGVYRVHRVPDGLERGMLVLVPVPDPWKMIAFARGWVHEPWWPDRATLLKPIGAVASDRVCRERDTLWINGEGYGPVVQESYGTVIPAALAEGECLVVPPGYVFLASKVEKSFDSRYYGCVQVSKVAHLLTPFYVW